MSNYEEHLSDYVFAMGYHKDFNVLQLTDIHWNMTSSTYESKDYLEKLLNEVERHIHEVQGDSAKIDLVELTGDQFMLSNSFIVESFLKFFEEQAEKHGFQYAVIWGNHDRHGLYNPNWLGEQFANAKHCFYFEPNDNLYGRSNFIINLTEDGTKAGAIKWQIANLDSGASFSETSVSPFRDYDYIRKDQTQWWLKEHQAAGANVPGLAYYHIPQDENGALWEAHKESGLRHKFFKLEGFADNGNEEYASDFIDVAIKNNLKGAFQGHAHNVDWTVEMNDEETGNKLLLGLGVKTGSELYFAHIDAQTTDPDMKEGLESVGIHENFDLIGASLVTITDASDDIQGKFDLEHVYFNEREGGDFAEWVKW
ncbi:MAG: metallophosphoesterase [Bacilli bacterium]|nr:metallophosphoesterase [Bacilli bacterium]